MWAKRWFSTALVGACGLTLAGCDLAEYDAATSKQAQQLLSGVWSSQRDTQHPLAIDPAGNLRLWTGRGYSPSARPMTVEPGGRGFRVEILFPDGQKRSFSGQLLTDDRLSLQLLEKPDIGYPRTVVFARVPANPPPAQKQKK